MAEQEPLNTGESGMLPPIEPAIEPESPAGWAARLTELDFYKEHKTAIGVLGAAATALGVGAYAISKRQGGGKFSIRFGDRRMEEHRVISIVELVEKGAAVSVPIGRKALEALGKSKEIFSMSEEGFGYPLEDESHVPKHARTAQKFAGLLREQFVARIKKSKSDS